MAGIAASSWPHAAITPRALLPPCDEKNAILENLIVGIATNSSTGFHECKVLASVMFTARVSLLISTIYAAGKAVGLSVSTAAKTTNFSVVAQTDPRTQRATLAKNAY